MTNRVANTPAIQRGQAHIYTLDAAQYDEAYQATVFQIMGHAPPNWGVTIQRSSIDSIRVQRGHNTDCT